MKVIFNFKTIGVCVIIKWKNVIFLQYQVDVLLFYRNNSARELSAFAESAMAVNRVVLQHFSMNLDLSNLPTQSVLESSPAVQEPGSDKGAGEGTTIFGLSPPSESRLLQRRKAQSLTKKHDSKVEENSSTTDPSGGKKITNLIVVASTAPVVVVASPSG